MRYEFAGKALATYEDKNTEQIYSYVPDPCRTRKHGDSFGAIENGKQCGQHSHCC